MKIADRLKNFEGYGCGPREEGIHLDKNETPFGLPNDIKDDIFEELRETQLNRYPPLIPETLEKKIADYVGCSTEKISVGNGSDALLPLLFELFDADQVVLNPTTFSMYSFYAKRKGLEINEIPLDENFVIPSYLDVLEKRSIICICSPNNPTGNRQPRDQIIEALESENIVILDEAYVEFSRESNIDLIEKYDNLIVLRTLSKAFGLAGLRIGYCVGSVEMMEYLNKIRSPFSQDILSIKIAERLFEYTEMIENNVKKIVDERDRIFKRFKDHAYPSQSNFILIDLDAYEYLRDRGIHVRKMGGRLEGMIRVTVGKEEENDELISELERFIEGSKR
ncbi:MAG: histidinol-phosphate transaminase [Candidatus Thermoplasmatota archaeon]|nr:histidinol-phosphate transaminase [Candidatus Thermoplasmatota archaeon]MBS3789970.1 histidinol-phosphate transaminase [Candidatus Thermoplasmatota archaeon]